MTIHFKSKLSRINSQIIVHLPKQASEKLPSRGMAMVKGTINGFRFEAPLEPDGKGSHWLRIDKKMHEAIEADAGDTVTLAIEPVKEWSEPEIPADLKKALATSPEAQTLWKNITPIVHWDWVRWLRSTKNPETRRKRIETTLSMLKAGKGRRCCFNRSMCTEPDVSNNGVLLKPTQTAKTKAKRAVK